MKRMLLLVAAAGIVALPPGAYAGVAFEPSMERGAISWTPGREVVYRLRMTTGADSERFRVELESPGWGLPLFPNMPVGQPLIPKSGGVPVTVSGPGSLRSVGMGIGDFGGGACVRGGSYGLSAEGVSLPPNSTSTLVARYRLSFDSAPFPDTDLRLTFVASGGTLEGEQSFRPDRPRLRPPYGVRIGLTTRPRSRYAGSFDPLRIRPGQRLDLRGTAHGVRRRIMVLRYAGPGSGSRLRTLARVRTDARGRFRYDDWRPAQRGLHELTAVYRGSGSRFTKDRSCFRAFVVR